MFYRAVAATCPGNNKDYNSNNIYLNTKYITDDIKASEVLLKQKKEQEGLQFYGIAEGFGADNFTDEASLIAIKKLLALQKKVADNEISDNYDEAADVVYSYLDEFIKSANDAVSAKAGELSDTNIYASIAVMGLYETAAITCNLGNTRIYLFRKGHLSRLSEDHNYAQMMYKNGVITADKVSSHPKKKKLTQYLGIMPDDKQPEPYYSEVEVRHGDIFLICSSSFCNSIEDAAICDIVKDSKSLSQIAEKLMQAAAEKGFTEDTSIMVIRADEHQNDRVPAAGAAAAAGTAGAVAASKSADSKINAGKPVKENDLNPAKRSFMDKIKRFLGLSADSENEKVWPAIIAFGSCILVVIILVVLGIKIFQASRSPSGGTQQPSAIIGTPSAPSEIPSTSSPTPTVTPTNNQNTSAPTQKPTQAPTQEPTTKPTEKPTETPATPTPETPTETPATPTPETPTETPATPTPETPTETPATPTPETPTETPATPTPEDTTEEPTVQE